LSDEKIIASTKPTSTREVSLSLIFGAGRYQIVPKVIEKHGQSYKVVPKIIEEHGQSYKVVPKESERTGNLCQIAPKEKEEDINSYHIALNMSDAILCEDLRENYYLRFFSNNKIRVQKMSM
jgi:hypothetical protein